jgi:chromosome condensin MukBEF complex kleisin-like MukF subunit
MDAAKRAADQAKAILARIQDLVMNNPSLHLTHSSLTNQRREEFIVRNESHNIDLCLFVFIHFHLIVNELGTGCGF